jgi:hypothetical protein
MRQRPAVVAYYAVLVVLAVIIATGTDPSR